MTFVVIPTRSGRQRLFSLDKRLLYFLLLVVLLLAGSGAIGTLKSGQNMELSLKKQQLEAEQQQMQTIARKVTRIEQEERAIHDLLETGDREQSGQTNTARN